MITQSDGSEIKLYNEETLFMLVVNGKYGGGRVVMCPSAILNDGLLDLVMQAGPAGTRELAKFIKSGIV